MSIELQYSRPEVRVWSPRLFYFIFFLSGATGLVYQVIWVRLTGLVFGNTSHAIAVVLGAFMAGLALGSFVLGRYADRVRSPLRLYGMLEIGIGLTAALVPPAFSSLDTLYWTLAPSLDAIPGGNGLARFVTSFAILLAPTFLMGGTLPALTRFFTGAVEEIERKVGVLYALNTYGAAVGTLAAALIFIPGIGNIRTTLIVAAVNVAIGALSIGLAGSMEGRAGSSQKPAAAAPAIDAPVTPASPALVLATLAVSGFVAMLYEVAWARALASMLGSSTYAFSIMLVTFLVGIAGGSTIVGRWRPTPSLRLLGLLQLGVAVGGVIFLVGYILAPYLLLSLVRALFYSFPAILTVQFLVSAALMIFATLCMGASFPVATQLYSREFRILGRSIGSVYSINTIGSIAGSLIAGFVLLPLIGTERTIVAGLFFNSAMALLLLSEESVKSTYARYAAVALLLVATLSMAGGVFWSPEMMDRGVLIYAQTLEGRPELKIREFYDNTDVVFFREGHNASISVRRGEAYVGLRTNGKVDASNREDMITQLSVAYLPGFYHPAPESMLIIGYGSGVTVGAATVIPEVREIDCVEIEEAVVEAAPYFARINRRSWEDQRVRIIYDDARNYMNITRKQYDVIISEPSNPWIAGVASLFTAEFYDRAIQVLKPDGVFAQWVQLYGLDPEDLRMIMYEFQRVFPEVTVWNTNVGDLILIGSREPIPLDLARVREIFDADPSVQRDFHEFLHLDEPEGILAYYVMSNDQARAFASDARRNTDDHPILEFHAPRQLFTETRNLNLALLYKMKVELVPPHLRMPDPETTFRAMVDPLLRIDQEGFANEAASMLASMETSDSAAYRLARAAITMDSGNLAAARSELESATEIVEVGHPLFAELQERWGLLLDRFGEAQQAIAHFELADNVDPERPTTLLRLAELHAQQSNWAEAAAYMERYIATHPELEGHYLGVLGDYYLAASRNDEALAALARALDIDPYTFWARRRLARLAEDRGDRASAIDLYEFIIRHHLDRDADTYIQLINLYIQESRPADARRVAEKGHRIFPTDAEIYRLYRGL